MDILKYLRFPGEMRDIDQWVNWRLEERDGKMTKIPYQCNGFKAKSNDPDTWHSFDEVVTEMETGIKEFDGIGFVLTENDPYLCVDIDDTCSDAVIEDTLKRLGGYVEASPSGNGLHIWLKATKPTERCRNTKLDVEVYTGKRFITVTGDRTSNGILDIDPKEFNTWFFKVFPPLPLPRLRKAGSAGNGKGRKLKDEAVVKRVGNSPSAGLWDGTDALCKHDHSTADMKLVCCLLRITGGDTAQAERLFRKSALMRNKWDEMRGSQTYGELTMNNAAEVVKEEME